MLLPRSALWVFLGFALPRVASAQIVPAATTTEPPPVALSPFVVSSDRDTGYRAVATLAASRLDTELRDTAAAISVFTKEFLNDIGVTNVVDAMAFALNGGGDTSDYHGIVMADRSDGTVQLRGFGRATLLRDYFPFGRSADMFNTDRVDLARGPNSVLFGIGSVGGVVNAASKQARFDRSFGEASIRVGSWENVRGTFDLNRPLSPRLAVRVNAVVQDQKGWRDFEFLNLKGAALGATWRPWRATRVRVQSEYIDRRQTVAYPWGPTDMMSSWLDAGRPLAATAASAVTGTVVTNDRSFVYDPASPLGPVSWAGQRVTTPRSTVTPASAVMGPALFRFELVPRRINLMGAGSRGDNHYGNHSVFLEQRVGPLVLEVSANSHRSQRLNRNPIYSDSNGVRGDANALLPNGAPNPNAGRLYVEGHATYTVVNERFDHLRLTASLERDWRARGLGKHRFAFLASREGAQTDFIFFREMNTTPAGNALYPLALGSAGNFIQRRTYLDFRSHDLALLGAHDPKAFPIRGVNGVTAEFKRVTAPALLDTQVDAAMVAAQSSFWQGRLHVLAGLRRDVQTAATADGASWTREPVTLLYLTPTRWNVARYGGNTGTLGIVAHAHRQVSLFINLAENFVPQTSYAPDGGPIGPRTGLGRDYGVKLSLLDGRVSAVLARFELKQANGVGGTSSVTNAMLSITNDIWRVVDATRLRTTFVDTSDTDGRGWEGEVTAQLTPRWRLAANLSHAAVEQNNTFPRIAAYFEENRAAWLARGATRLTTVSTQIPANKRTVAGAVETLDSLYRTQAVADSRAPYQFRRTSVNVFSNYTLAGDTPLVGPLTFGGGMNFRSAPVAGYHTTTFQPLYGGKSVSFNAQLGRTFRLKGNRPLRVQLNVDNLLDNQDLIITDRDETALYRYVFQRPRTWALASTLGF